MQIMVPLTSINDQILKEKILWLVGTSTSNNWKSFLILLKNIIEYMTNTLKIIDEKFIIVWDNASLHTSKEVRSCILNTKVIIWAITPYYPYLNLVQRRIMISKRKLIKCDSKRGWWKFRLPFNYRITLCCSIIIRPSPVVGYNFQKKWMFILKKNYTSIPSPKN